MLVSISMLSMFASNMFILLGLEAHESGPLSALNKGIAMVTLSITLLICTHEPPSHIDNLGLGSRGLELRAVGC